MTDNTILNETTESLKRMQEFDAQSLERMDDLGQSFQFQDAVSPASDLIRLYSQLAVSVLSDLPNNNLQQIKKQADADYSRFEQILNFDPTSTKEPTQQRQSYLDQLTNSYQQAFAVLHPFISYGVSKSVDSQRMETEARALLQSIKDQASGVTDALKKSQNEADNILEDVRKAAAEQGVSQQASYFKADAEHHSKEADIWRGRVIKLTWTLSVLAVISIFIHKMPFLSPKNVAESIQLIASKVILFTAVGYMLVLSARNFMSHKHNAVVNKHRQNALMTFKALVDAAKEGENKEIILTHASSCIFSPQDTGYTRQSSGNSSQQGISISDVAPKTVLRTDTSS